MNRVGRDVYKAVKIAKTLRNHFKGEQQDGYLGTLKYLLKEAEYLGDTVESVQRNFEDYRALGAKAKRSLLPVGGSILSFLFGTLMRQIYLTYVRLSMTYQEINKQWSICWKNK